MAILQHSVVKDTLTRAGHYLANAIEQAEQPVYTPYEFFYLILKMYREPKDEKLYLRAKTPTAEDYVRHRTNLKNAGVIGADRDYGSKIIRALAVPDRPADEIVCLADRLCYISHISAMQRWGITNRRPDALFLTRPDRNIARQKLQEIMAADASKGVVNPYPLKNILHPKRVRRRPLHVLETKTLGKNIRARGSAARLATIGQTFLDTIQNPVLCGGMSHVLDVWEEHAKYYLDEIIESVDHIESSIVKSRAGYILEERLLIKADRRIDAWKAFVQRGGSRKLDPTKDFAPTYSEKWMISLNA
ncbi:hypothetical protein [Parvibaculum sp.]|uniref:hypothetical protein n=1 Tax=Parvibaculum sp. TaxID=2024848 RepID=UPI001D72A620|nr:hypothetical protein [Parvibaculum sp.]MBX3490394.1 hypothetical protein [Parvibaculum sp.]MCW5728251.1 hypothetical protein [Parvibaculum sp.]